MIGLAFVAALGLLALPATASAAFTTNAECLACHDRATGTGAISKVDFSAQPGAGNVDYTKCNACHWIGLDDQVTSAFGHGHQGPCSACHLAAAPYGTFDPMRIQKVTTPYGQFNSATSLSVGGQQAHAIHVSGSWPKNSIKYGSQTWYRNYCESCHGNTACDSCHTLAIQHADHTLNTATASYAYGPVAYVAARGTAVGNAKFVYNVAAVSLTCANPACHAPAAAGTTAFTPFCGSCHPTNTADHGYASVDHTATVGGQLETGSTTACGACHSMDLMTEHAKPTSNGPRDCTTCHPSPRSAFTAWNKGCDQCHGVGTTPAKHADALVKHGLASDAVCVTCHTGALPAVHSLATTTVAGVTYTDCLVCHNATKSPSLPGSTCVSCHFTFDGHYNTTKHASTWTLGATCGGTGCHVVGEADLMNVHARFRAFTCFECHSSTRTEVTAAIAAKSTACDACHPTATQSGSHRALHLANPPLVSGLLATPNYSYQTGSAGTTPTSDCIGCHTSNLVDEHMGVFENGSWTRVPRKDGTGAALTCASCHGSLDTAVTTAIALKKSSCESCHAVHGPIPQVHRSTYADTQAVPCADCHSADISFVHNGTISTTTPSGATLSGCAICHSYYEGTRGAQVQAAIEAKDTRCSTCHAASHSDRGGHTPLASGKCAGCHAVADTRPIHAGRTEGACAVCHANPVRVGAVTAKTAECVSCHAAIDAAVSAHPSYTAKHVSTTAACAASGCHAIGDIAALHSKATTTVAGVTYTSCSVCHRSPTSQPTSSDCVTCHATEGTDYHVHPQLHTSPTAGGCYGAGCHDASQSLPTIHEPYVGPNNEYKYASTCDLCHRNTDPARINWATVNGRCSSCHGIAVHSKMSHAATSATSQSCLPCHTAQNRIEPIHGAYYVTSGTTDKCATCHNQPGAGDITWKYATSDCENCHASLVTPDPKHYNETSHTVTFSAADDCGRCHLASMKAEHARPSIPVKVDCLGCHTSARYTALALPWDHRCESCHAAKHGTLSASHASSTTSCSGGDCHAIGDVGALHSLATTTVAGVTYTSCAVCHRSPLEQPTTTDCAACHAGHGNLDAKHTATSSASATCITCHPPADARTIHQRLGCAVCHKNPARVPTLPASIECANCHAGHGDITAKHTAAASAECVACHETADVTKLHPTKGCWACHTNPAVPVLPLTVECANCHGALSPTDPNHYPTANHAATGQTGTGCWGCHYSDMKAEHSKSTVAPPVTCVSCHETKVDAFTSAWDKTCDRCHATKHTAMATKHASSTTGCGGTQCHQIGDVAAIHAAAPNGCATCHTGPGAPATTTNCSAAGCHASVGPDHHALHDTASVIDAGCKGCHYTYLDDEHAALGYTCATCHKATNAAVQAAIAGKQRACSACHPAVNGRNRHAAQNTTEFIKGNQSAHRAYATLPGARSSFMIGGTTYTWTLPSDAAYLKTGWTSSSVVTCDKCHTFSGTATGPHGAAVKVNIDPAYPTSWKSVYLTESSTSSSTFICAKCHTGFNRMNATHGKSDHNGSTDGRCVACHTQVPHGWRLPRLLAYTNDPAPYNSLNLTGVRLASRSSSNWDLSDCSQTGCSEHSSSMSNRWPSTVLTYGTLRGRVVDDAGVAIGGAAVTTDKGQSTTTDATGSYDFGSLGVATYNVTVAKSGYVSQTKAATLLADQVTALDFALVPVPVNYALGKTFSASRTYSSSYAPNYAGDGSLSTYWRTPWLSSSTQIEWLSVDLGTSTRISKAEVVWASNRHATEYRVYTSSDNATWTQVYASTTGAGGTSAVSWTAGNARYVKVECRRASSTNSGYGIAELRVFK